MLSPTTSFNCNAISLFVCFSLGVMECVCMCVTHTHSHLIPSHTLAPWGYSEAAITPLRTCELNGVVRGGRRQVGSFTPFDVNGAAHLSLSIWTSGMTNGAKLSAVGGGCLSAASNRSSTASRAQMEAGISKSPDLPTFLADDVWRIRAKNNSTESEFIEVHRTLELLVRSS